MSRRDKKLGESTERLPQRRLEQVVMHPHVDDDDADFDVTLAPLDPEVEEARNRIREPGHVPSFPEFDGPTPPPLQYSLKHVLLGTTVLAIALALLQALQPDMIAGAVGLVALSVYVAVNLLQPVQKQAYVLAYGLILLYVVTTAVALVGA